MKPGHAADGCGRIHFMRPLSDKTFNIVKNLYKPESFLSFGRINKKRSLLAQLAESGESGAAHYVLPFLLNKNTLLSATKALARLVEDATPSQLWEFSDMIWRTADAKFSVSSAWCELNPAQVEQFDTTDPDSVWALGAASVHGNGYVREAAVRCLAKRVEPVAIGFLLARANDWVAEVRACAKAGLWERVKQKPGDFGAFLTLLDRLALCSREAHQGFVDDVRIALLREGGLPGLRNAVKSPDRYMRRAAYRLALSASDISVREFAVSALNDDDNVVRTLAARKIASSPDLADLVALLHTNREASVRRVALEWASSLVPPDVQVLSELIFDTNAGIREHARFFVRRDCNTDLASLYREALKNEKLCEVAILGLGEIGARDDVEHVRAFLSSDKARYRRVAVLALSRLLASSEVDPFIVALNDASVSVSNAALFGLMKRDAYVSKEQLWDVFLGTDKDFVKKNIIRLFARFPKWAALAQLVRVSAETLSDVRELAVSLVYRWLEMGNRSFVSPSPQQLREIEQGLAMAKTCVCLPYESIDAVLKIWAPKR